MKIGDRINKMKINDTYRKMLVDEINFVVKKMEETQDGTNILYYFSAVFGIFHRILNMDYSNDLIYAHFVLRSTHEVFQQRLKAIQQGVDRTVLISDQQFEKLIALSRELLDKIQKKSSIDETLKKFIVLSYSTTGNGYYLMQKGQLKI